MKGSSLFSGMGPHSLPYPAYLCHYQRLEEWVRVLQQSGGCHAPGCPALKSEIALGLKRDHSGEDAKPRASFEARSLWNGGKAARPYLTFQRGI